MSNEDVLSRREMKQPDKFQEVAKRALDWISGHKKNSRLVVIVLLGFVLVVAILMVLSAARAEKAGALGYEVVRTVGAELSAVPLPGVSGPFFASDAERQKAVIAAADHALAEYPSTAAGRLTLLMKADAQLRLGDFEDAVVSYRRYLDETPSYGSLRFGALEGLAIAHEGAGRLDEAAAAWEREAREVPLFADRAELERARVLAAAGKTDEARKLLEGFAAKHPGSTFATEAADRLARLGSK